MYSSRYCQYWDACRVCPMHIGGDQSLIYNIKFDKNRDTVVAAWIRRRCNGGSRGAIEFQCMHISINSPFVLYYKEVDNEPRFDPDVSAHSQAYDRPFTTVLFEVVGFCGPCTELCSNSNLAHWAKEAGLEYRNHFGKCGRCKCGCYNV